MCAYHRPGLTVGFDAFRLAAITALCGWASFCVAGLRSFGGRGLRFVVPLLLAAALGSEVFVGNVTYFNTHSYQPFQLLDYLDPNVNVIRGQGSISLDEDHTYMRFFDIDQPIYNLSMDGLTNDDTDPLHWDSFFNFRINATDEANSQLNYFGTWQIAPESTRSQVISLDLTGNVGTMELTASGYSTAFAAFPVAVTFTGITANAPRPLQFSLLRCIAVFLALLAIYALRPQSGLWHRRWLAGNVCDRAAGAVLAAILAAFVVVVPFWEPGNTGLATENYNVAFWDHESKISFVYEQYGALAHSLLNGRLDLMQDPPEELLALPQTRQSLRRRPGAAGFVWLAVAGMVIITVVDCEMAGVLYRYLMDYSPVLLLGAVLCWLLLESVLARRAAAGETLAVTLLPVLRVAMAAAVAWSAVYRFFTLFATQPWLQGLNPSLYFNVARLAQFWM